MGAAANASRSGRSGGGGGRAAEAEEETVSRDDHARDGSTVLVGRLAPGWFVTRIAFVIAATAVVVWLMIPARPIVVMFGISALVGQAWLAISIVRVAMSVEPRFVVSTSEVVSRVGVLGSLPSIRRSDLRELQVLISRGTLSFVSASGKRMNVPWRWIVLDDQSPLDILDAARLLRDRLALPTSVLTGLRDTSMTAEPLI
jgi:hypothetical protein